MPLLGEVALDRRRRRVGPRAATRQVEWTGDYLDDERFTHTPGARRVRARERRSARSSPRRSSIATSSSARSPSTATARTPSTRRTPALLAGARRPGRGRDRQRPAHRRARALARGDRPASRLGADAARDRGPGLGHPRAGRGPPADRRRVDPPARVRRRPDRPVGPRHRGAALVVRRRRRDGRRPGVGAGPAASSRARPWPARRSPSSAPVRTDDYLADDRFARDDPARDVRRVDAGIRSVVAVPLPGEAGPIGTLSVVSRQVARLRRRRRRDADRPRHAGVDRHPQRATASRSWPARARSSSGGPRPNRRCARSPPGSPRSASRATCSSASSTRRAGCCAPTAPSSTSTTQRRRRPRHGLRRGADR